MQKTIFEITKMDCPSEENLIRMKLDAISSIVNLDFDIPNRKLTVFRPNRKVRYRTKFRRKENFDRTDQPIGI